MPEFDVLIRNAIICDGSGSTPVPGDVAIRDGVIAAIGQLDGEAGKREIDAQGLVVAPGFINMLSWAVESLIVDGRSQSDIRQGVTLEVVGEASSMGPLSDEQKDHMRKTQGDIQYEIEWTTVGEYLDFLVNRGISCNIASFVGATTIRSHVIGYDDRAPTAQELERMQQLVREAMQEGAVGLSSALVYPPGSYARTDELIALNRVVAEYKGTYISHLRSEGDSIEEALTEFLTIVRQTGVSGEIYHLKVAGQSNWGKLEEVVARIELAQAEGLPITADMYTYCAAGTGLSSVIPPWVHDGGDEALIARLRDISLRDRIKQEMNLPSKEWENFYLAAGSPENILIVGTHTNELKPYIGKTLAEVAQLRRTPPEDTAMDLLTEDRSRVSCVYFMMSEANVRRQIQLPWVSFCSDAKSAAPEGVFLKSSTHPRAYGTFARLLGRYARDEKLIPLEEAVRRLTSFPAQNLKIARRGLLRERFFADVVVFDPETIQDHATFTEPHRYATGMIHVFVNGVQVLEDGEHTGALPGKVVRGPGWKS